MSSDTDEKYRADQPLYSAVQFTCEFNASCNHRQMDSLLTSNEAPEWLGAHSDRRRQILLSRTRCRRQASSRQGLAEHWPHRQSPDNNVTTTFGGSDSHFLHWPTVASRLRRLYRGPGMIAQAGQVGTRQLQPNFECQMIVNSLRISASCRVAERGASARIIHAPLCEQTKVPTGGSKPCRGHDNLGQMAASDDAFICTSRAMTTSAQCSQRTVLDIAMTRPVHVLAASQELTLGALS